MSGAAASGAGSESRAGAEVVDVDCIPATDTEKYETTISGFIGRNPGIAATDPNTGTLKLLEKQMEQAFTQNLIKSIEKQLEKAKISQESIESANKYFTALFTGYKTHLDKKTNEMEFSDKLELLKRVFNAYPQPLRARRSMSSNTQSDFEESQSRRDGKNDPRTIKLMFTNSIYLYEQYLRNILFADKPAILEKIENAFKQLNRNEDISPEYHIKCERTTKDVQGQGQNCDFFLSITQNKIELRCNLQRLRNPVYECALYKNEDNRSVLFVVKITGKQPGFSNVHITQVLPIFRQTPSNPHITFTHNKPEKRLYIDCSSGTFSLHQMLENLDVYIMNPNQTTIGLFLSMNNEYIKELYIKLSKKKKEKEKEKDRYTPYQPRGSRTGRGGGSTNKILKIKEQIKIIRGKYKTTKLDKYLIQIDKLKEKIEQLKLKDKKNKIKEQIKEVKALHKLNPKKAYVNKMIKLKEKLNNM